MQPAHEYPDASVSLSAWDEAERYGIDMSGLLANLDKTVLERIRNHDRALTLARRSDGRWRIDMANFENLLARLIEHQVEFVLVGGFAATAYGSTLLTQDVEVCMQFSTDNLMRLQEALADLHPVHRLTPRRLPLRLTPETCRGLKNLYLNTDLGQLDCLGMIQGVGDFKQVKEHSVDVDLPAGICRILSLEALIRTKEAMGRPRDRESALQLKAIRDRRRRQEPGSIPGE